MLFRSHAGLTGKWALAKQLRRQGFDLAVLFQNAFEAAFLTFLPLPVIASSPAVTG